MPLPRYYQEGRTRLAILLRHMRSPHRGHPIFKFSCYNTGALIPASSPGGEVIPSCRMCGCMAGELPILFPQDWVFSKSSGAMRSYPKLHELPDAMSNRDTFDRLGAMEAIGERDPVWRPAVNPTLVGLVEFFGLTVEEVNVLFVPDGIDSLPGPELGQLDGEATLGEVTGQLSKFIRYFDQVKPERMSQ